jgi:hypothetical protein
VLHRKLNDKRIPEILQSFDGILTYIFFDYDPVHWEKRAET